jgi:simple sugar transport system permease protein
MSTTGALPRGVAPPRLPTAFVRSLAAVGFALVAFTALLAVTGRDPFDAYAKVFRGTLGSRVGLAEIGVRMVPILLTALAAAIPARLGLINVGGEGQLYLGAWAATAMALFVGGPIWSLLPLMMAAGFAGGAFWAGTAMLLRHWRGVNEVISTLLMNYIAVLFVNVFVFGPWKNPAGFNYPYTRDFDAGAVLPSLFDSRLHAGIVLPLAAVVLAHLVLTRTRWGFNMRAIGGNAEASKRRGIPVARYMAAAVLVGGGVAGVAGMVEVSGVQHHLRPGISNGLGMLGFLASWLADHNPVTIVATSFLLALVSVSGDLLQFSADLPSAAMNVLVGLILFFVLTFRAPGRKAAA